MSNQKKYALLFAFAIYFTKSLIIPASYSDAIVLLGLVAAYLYSEYKTSELQFVEITEKFAKAEERILTIEVSLKKAQENYNSMSLSKQISQKGFGSR